MSEHDNAQESTSEASDGAPPELKLDWERTTKNTISVQGFFGDRLFHVDNMNIHSATARDKFATATSTKLQTQFDQSITKEAVEQLLIALAIEVDKAPEADDDGIDADAADRKIEHGYFAVTNDPDKYGMYRRSGDGRVSLTNFVARIVGQFIEDDGVERRLTYEIKTTLPGQTYLFRIPASQFQSMTWVPEHAGARAVTFAGLGTKDHARVAIQLLSGDVPTTVLYTHMGWTEIERQWVYLHGGGAIVSHDDLDDTPSVRVRLSPPLDRFVLPEPNMGKQLITAAKASLNFLKVAPYRVTIPLYSSMFRTVLGGTDFSLHLAGRTGAGKSELCALVQQHWGPTMDARHLPASWSSTANANEALAFTVKDALLTVDDFVPAGTAYDMQKLNREADRLLRGQGNGSGRGRMRADTTLRAAKPPRCLILSTGEDIPRGQSLRARLFVLDVAAAEVDWERLTLCQHDASAGTYALLMADFIQWLAPQYEEVREQMAVRVVELRELASTSSMHKRTPAIVASLYFGLELFCRFAVDAAAITEERAQKLLEKGWEALGEAAALQKGLQEDSDPATRFLALLEAALTAGKAHVADKEGQRPDDGACWGWRTDGDGSPVSQGNRIGWVDGRHLYLEPEASYAVVQRMGGEGSEPLGISSQTLRKRLHERGMLASVDDARGRLTVRRTLDGKIREVIHLPARLLCQKVLPVPSG